MQTGCDYLPFAVPGLHFVRIQQQPLIGAFHLATILFHLATILRKQGRISGLSQVVFCRDAHNIKTLSQNATDFLTHVFASCYTPLTMSKIDHLSGSGVVMKGRNLLSWVKYRVTVTTDPEAAYPHYFLEIVSSDPLLTMLPDRLTLIVEDARKL